jgi:hypothetical protein
MGIKSISNEKINIAKPSMKNKIFKNILNLIKKQYDNDTLKKYLSTHMSGNEQKYIKEAFDTNWWRMNVTGFEQDIENI